MTRPARQITAVAKEARLKDFGEKALIRILATLTRSLREESERSVTVTASHLDYAKKLCVDPGCVVLDSVPLEKPLEWMSSLQFHTALDGASVPVKMELPASIFDEKDYLNHQYTWKKFLYLQYCQQIWAKLTEVLSCRICFYREDLRSPYLCLEWKTAFGSQK